MQKLWLWKKALRMSLPHSLALLEGECRYVCVKNTKLCVTGLWKGVQWKTRVSISLTADLCGRRRDGGGKWNDRLCCFHKVSLQEGWSSLQKKKDKLTHTLKPICMVHTHSFTSISRSDAWLVFIYMQGSAISAWAMTHFPASKQQDQQTAMTNCILYVMKGEKKTIHGFNTIKFY